MFQSSEQIQNLQDHQHISKCILHIIVFLLSFGACMTTTKTNRKIKKKEKMKPGTRQYFRQRLIAFYKKYCPEKIKNVDKILDKYAGRELILFVRLRKKYVQDWREAETTRVFMHDPTSSEDEDEEEEKEDDVTDEQKQCARDEEKTENNPKELTEQLDHVLNDDIIKRVDAYFANPSMTSFTNTPVHSPKTTARLFDDTVAETPERSPNEPMEDDDLLTRTAKGRLRKRNARFPMESRNVETNENGNQNVEKVKKSTPATKRTPRTRKVKDADTLREASAEAHAAMLQRVEERMKELSAAKTRRTTRRI